MKISMNIIRTIKLINRSKTLTNKEKRELISKGLIEQVINVYKVIVFANPNRKNGHRYGVNDMVVIHDKINNPKNIPFPKLKNELKGSEVGNKIFMYYPRTEVLNCFEGEDSISNYISV